MRLLCPSKPHFPQVILLDPKIQNIVDDQRCGIKERGAVSRAARSDHSDGRREPCQDSTRLIDVWRAVSARRLRGC